MQRFALVLLLLAAVPAVAQQVPEIKSPAPGEGGDAELPPGYKSVVWSASPEIVMGIRERGMEPMNAANPHVSWLIDTPQPGETDLKEVVKWKFWDGRLVEVHIHYEGPFTRKEGRDLVGKFQRHYGEGKHEFILAPKSTRQQRDIIQSEWWTWEDPFTIQVLKFQDADKSWLLIRHSRVLEDARRAQEQRELEEERTRRVQGIELD
ncbi:MAG: hypothetical protein GY898_30830 [Proteobacteria bacterium]|nr:hypothetical protein [Pseudomonadota bacterium]